MLKKTVIMRGFFEKCEEHPLAGKIFSSKEMIEYHNSKFVASRRSICLTQYGQNLIICN